MTKEYKINEGLFVHIIQDDDPHYMADDMITYALFHPKFSFENNSGLSTNDFHSWDEMKEKLLKTHKHILPVFMYNHGGIIIRTSPFSCSWDSGQIGWVATNEEFSDPEQVLKDTIEEYNQYINGEIYGFNIIHRTLCSGCGEATDVIGDSLWGFVGDDLINNGMLDNMDLISEYEKLLISAYNEGIFTEISQ